MCSNYKSCVPTCFAANVIIPLLEFDSGELVDKWYTLNPHAAVRCDVGSVRLRTRYIHQVIMPVEQYTSLKDVSHAIYLMFVLNSLFNYCIHNWQRVSEGQNIGYDLLLYNHFVLKCRKPQSWKAVCMNWSKIILYVFCLVYLQLILTDFNNVVTLANVCVSDKVSLAKALLNLFRHERQVKMLLKNSNDYYINKEGMSLLVEIL